MGSVRLSEDFQKVIIDRGYNILEVCRHILAEDFTQDELNDFEYMMDRLDIYEEEFDIILGEV